MSTNTNVTLKKFKNVSNLQNGNVEMVQIHEGFIIGEEDLKEGLDIGDGFVNFRQRFTAEKSEGGSKTNCKLANLVGIVHKQTIREVNQRFI